MQREPIDLDHLARQTLGDRALEREVLVLFSDQARLLASRLNEAEADERRMIAHTIRGAAGGVGAFELAECAARLERDPDEHGLLGPLQVLVEEVCRFVEALGQRMR